MKENRRTGTMWRHNSQSGLFHSWWQRALQSKYQFQPNLPTSSTGQSIFVASSAKCEDRKPDGVTGEKLIYLERDSNQLLFETHLWNTVLNTSASHPKTNIKHLYHATRRPILNTSAMPPEDQWSTPLPATRRSIFRAPKYPVMCMYKLMPMVLGIENE